MTKTLEERAAEVMDDINSGDYCSYDDAYVYSILGEVTQILSDQQARIRELEGQKDGAYSERNKLVSALSKLFPSWLEQHPEEDEEWEDDWRTIVFIQLPTGQASWHLHDSEINQFFHLEKKVGNSWDGHTTEEKYKRLGSLKLEAEPTMEEVEAAAKAVSLCKLGRPINSANTDLLIAKAALEAARKVRETKE